MCYPKVPPVFAPTCVSHVDVDQYKPHVRTAHNMPKLWRMRVAREQWIVIVTVEQHGRVEIVDDDDERGRRRQSDNEKTLLRCHNECTRVTAATTISAHCFRRSQYSSHTVRAHEQKCMFA